MESLTQRIEVTRQVRLRDALGIVVPHPGRLGGVQGIRVVAERRDDGALAPALPIGGADRAHEAGGIVTGCRRGDEVDVRAEPPQPVPGLREQRLVRGGATGGRPEVGGVGLVPDDDVADLRDPLEHVVEELRVVPALDVVERRLPRVAVHGEHDALAAGDHRRRAMEIDADLPGRPVLAAPPRDRQPDGVDAEVAVRGQQPVGTRPPLRRVVVEADDELPVGGLCGRARSVRSDYACARKHHRP